MHRSLILFLLLLLSVSVFAQQTATEFRVFEEENEIQLPDSIRNQLANNQVGVHEILLIWLGNQGYLNAAIHKSDHNQVIIDRNCAFQLQQLSVDFMDTTQSDFILQINERYTRQALQSHIETLLQDLGAQGYPFAKAEITTLTPDSEECTLQVNVTIDKGEKAAISGIYFSGNEINSQDYLTKIARFEPGEIITPGYLRFLRNNLNSSELFNFVSEGHILLENGNPVVVFEVQERSMNLFDGLLGYVPDASGKGQIVGDVSLSLWNVFTQGSGLNFEYQRLRPETSELNLGVSQDWIGNLPVGLSAGLQIYQNDTTYQSRDVEVNGYYRISGSFKLIGGINYEATVSGNDNLNIIEPDGRKRTANLGFQYSNLDNYEVPTLGNRLSVIYGIANKNLEQDSVGSFIQNSLRIEAAQYIPMGNSSVIAFSAQAFLLEADKVTTNDLIRFGGANSFRGYAEQQFRAGRLLWGDVEYRFMLDRRSYLFTFGAVGGYYRPKLLTELNDSFRNTDYLYSTGFGLSYQTQIGRLKFTYAISPEESLSNGKVHFGITTQF
jgi:outer membrane protein assembly factor BamA